MTTPSETRAGKLPELIAKWRDESKVFASIGNQFDAGESWALAKCADELEALAASEPVEADGFVQYRFASSPHSVCVCFPSGQPLPGTKVYLRPAPERPGNGEALVGYVSQREIDRASKYNDVPVLGSRHDDTTIPVFARSTPQPSDPAEGDALRALIADWRERAKNGPGALNVAAKELEAALSTPPTAAVRVDDAMVERAGAAFNAQNEMSWDEPSMRAALTAALDPQVKR